MMESFSLPQADLTSERAENNKALPVDTCLFFEAVFHAKTLS